MKRKSSLWSIYKSILKTMFQLMWGIWKVCRLPQPVVTIFGGARFKSDDRYAQMAHDLAYKLVKEEISVITGGGPGIMSSANCGAVEAQTKSSKARSIGIRVKGLSRETKNDCAQEMITVDYFFARKWLMTQYALAFTIFPGGFGTLDELSEVITLMQTKKLPGVPVVLIGKDYWQPFIKWLRDTALSEGAISHDDFRLLQVTDDLDEAVQMLKEQCKICMVDGIK